VTSAIQLAFFLRMFATGTMAPVLALMLMAHGATIETLSLLIGAYSVTVVAAEFPSGVLADLFGQKRVFLLSALFGMLSFGLMLVSRSVLILLFVMILNGLSRAFASGTLDALAVNQTRSRCDVALLKITSRFSVLESAGLALGALVGGFLGGIGNVYAVNIAVNIFLYVMCFLLTLLFIHEKRVRGNCDERTLLRTLIRGQLKQSVSFIARKGIVRAVLVLSAVIGFALISVETFWQPAFSAFGAPSWTLGFVTFGSFFCVMVGSKLIERILRKHANHVAAAFLTLRAAVGAGLIALYFAAGAIPFAAVCMLSYFFLGGGSVAETTLIHREAKDDQRSSILSLFSFIGQIGGMLASAVGFVVSTGLGYRLMWPIAGSLLILCAGYLAFRNSKNKQSAQTPPVPLSTNSL
jgi:MFS family permease